MKLVSFRHQGKQKSGVVCGPSDLSGDRHILDLSALLAGRLRSLRHALEEAALTELEAAASHALAGGADTLALADVELIPPIPVPEKIVCIGVNYVNRNAEYKDDSDLPKWPSVFMRTPDSLVGHGGNIIRPGESEQLDYEGEIVIVIGPGPEGRPGRRIPEEMAEQYIGGLTIMNEGSVRDWLRHGKFNVTQGKNFARSGACGPWLVTADQFPNGFDDLAVTTTVNGEQRQHDSTASLLFPFRYLISYLSTFMILKPGDIIATGTPNGAGARFDPPKWLKPGDEVRVSVPGIGELANIVADEDS